MTSKEIHNDTKMKCALGVHYNEQIKVLKKALHYFEKMRFKTENMASYTKKRFQDGGCITINGVIRLQKILKENHNVEFFCTVTVTQCFLERQFGIYRAMGGSNTNPPALEFQRKVAQDLRCTLLADPEYDLLKNKTELEPVKKEIAEFDLDSALPVKIKDLDSEGLFWVAGLVAFDMRNVQADLGETDGKASE